MDIEYRAAKAEDAAGIAAVEVLAQQTAYRHFLPAAHLDSLSESHRTRVWHGFIQSDDPTRVIVAAHDQRVVGWMRIGKSSDPAMGYVFDLFVLPDYWGKGVGERLMRDAHLAFKDNGHKGALLYVFEDNMRARRFYVRLGWSADGRVYDTEISGLTVRFLCYKLTLED
ncbi:MAG TPA: GNAT family N-acetyltransferase [Chthonomonadaceae bacterium]|nr:GNAT family N-acetyltransferase [Chthonomonadaceae bacterium]